VNVVHLYTTFIFVASGSSAAGRGCRLDRETKPPPSRTAAKAAAGISLQTAIGVHYTQVQQKAMGMMGGSYNTREYTHGKTGAFLKSVKWIFLLLAFVVPVILLALGLGVGHTALLLLAFMTQYVGLLFERWFFFAQANHPQNLYCQTV